LADKIQEPSEAEVKAARDQEWADEQLQASLNAGTNAAVNNLYGGGLASAIADGNSLLGRMRGELGRADFLDALGYLAATGTTDGVSGGAIASAERTNPPANGLSAQATLQRYRAQDAGAGDANTANLVYGTRTTADAAYDTNTYSKVYNKDTDTYALVSNTILPDDVVRIDGVDTDFTFRPQGVAATITGDLPQIDKIRNFITGGRRDPAMEMLWDYTKGASPYLAAAGVGIATGGLLAPIGAGLTGGGAFLFGTGVSAASGITSGSTMRWMLGEEVTLGTMAFDGTVGAVSHGVFTFGKDVARSLVLGETAPYLSRLNPANYRFYNPQTAGCLGGFPEWSPNLGNGPRIEIRNNYKYKFDEFDRVDLVDADLVRNPAQGRNAVAQLGAGGDYRLAGDQGGHFIGRRFNGPLDDFNHFAQNGNFNMGAYKTLENSWDAALQQNLPVRVQIAPSYVGESLRPDTLHIRYWVDGVPDEQFFYNQIGGKRP